MTEVPDSDALPEMITAPPGPRSRALLRRLKAVESPGVTFVGDDFPVVWQTARAATVTDVDGNRYLDGGAGFGVAFIGHGHPRVVAAVREQAGRLLHGMGDVHPPAVRIALLEALAAIAPGDLGAGVLCGGGSEAVEVALKTALLATGKPGVIAFEGAYHGLATGALEVTARPDFRAPFAQQLAGNARFVPYPRPGQRDPSAQQVLRRIQTLLTDPAATRPIGAVIVEPLQGRGGNVIPDPALLPGLRQLCDANGVLLIADEIFTGCGRTGTFFACEAAGVVPDLLCVGKALGGGMPMSACLGRPQVMAAWGESTGEALHTSTFLGHPVASAAALATLAVIEDAALVAAAAAKGERLMALLSAGLAHVPGVVEVRGQGLMLGVELHHLGQKSAGERVLRVVGRALRQGVLLLPCGPSGCVLQLTPPACMTGAQLESLAAVVVDAIAAEAA